MLFVIMQYRVQVHQVGSNKQGGHIQTLEMLTLSMSEDYSLQHLLPYTLKTQVKQTHAEFEPNPFHYLAVGCNPVQC